MKVRYTCADFRPIIVDTAKDFDFDPALVFALRSARREYGKRGCVRICRLDSWAINGSFATYQAFICVPSTDGGYVGRNIWLTVYNTKID